MKFYYVTFRSVTPAQRGERILRSRGYHTTLLRTPRWMEEQGCGYCLRLWTDQPEGVLALLRENRIPLGRLYLQKRDGQLEEQAL